jgi:hypothetical protein
LGVASCFELYNVDDDDCDHRWTYIDLGVDSCFELYKVDDEHILTYSQDGLRVWKVRATEEHGIEIDVCVAFLRRPVRMHAGQPDHTDPRRLYAQDVSAWGIIVIHGEFNSDKETYVWRWRTHDTLERCADTMPHVKFSENVQIHRHPWLSCVVSATRRCFVGDEYVASYRTYSADDFLTHQHQVCVGAACPSRAAAPAVVHKGRLSTLTSRFHALPSILTCTLGDGRPVRLLVELFSDKGFHLVDLHSGRMRAYSFHDDVFKLEMDMDAGNMSMNAGVLRQAMDTSGRWLLPGDEGSRQHVNIVALDDIKPSHVLRLFSPSMVTCLPACGSISMPRTVRLFFLCFADDELNVVVDVDWTTWECTLKQVFTWRKRKDSAFSSWAHVFSYQIPVAPVGWMECVLPM